ncbi:MAG: hypothetical protein IJS88_03255 [Alphaproteobacteria bacterium]|nr:hypothetical protein [Alphaproteobacteria bacterium]
MTDTNSLNYEIIEQLFQNSVCLTYNPLEPRAAWQYAKELQRDFEKEHNLKYSRIYSKTAKLQQSRYNPDFHYFSDGTLIHCLEPWERDAKKLERILTLLKIRGWTVKKIYAPTEPMDIFRYSNFLRHITEQALIKYSYIEDLYAGPLPKKEDFVKQCFANGNILLTASKNEILPPQCRDFMALFADGSCYIIKDYNNPHGVKNCNMMRRLRQDYLWYYYYADEEVIPQDYMEALYKGAEKYDWFATKEDMEEKFHPHMSVNELIKMNKYIDNLFNGRTCLTVVNPPNLSFLDSTFISPDIKYYAVFNDGLVVSARVDERDYPFINALKRAFPNLDLHFEQVSREYIKQLYCRLPEFQKGATSIYIEMLKQKARKLKRITELTHIEALNVVAQMAGWQNWKAVKVEDEAHARQLISSEKYRKEKAVEKNSEHPLEEEYRRFLNHGKA